MKTENIISAICAASGAVCGSAAGKGLSFELKSGKAQKMAAGQPARCVGCFAPQAMTGKLLLKLLTRRQMCFADIVETEFTGYLRRRRGCFTLTGASALKER